MKATLTVEVAKGFYHETTLSGRNLRGILDKVLPALDEMPEEIAGSKGVDWVQATLVIVRSM